MNVSEEYVNMVRPLQDRVIELARQITGTSCSKPEDVKRFLIQYASFRAAVKHGRGIATEYERARFQPVEDYRKTAIKFWAKLAEQDCSLYRSMQPAIGDMKAAVTFFWAIYMTNNIVAETPGTENKEPYTFSWVKRQLALTRMYHEYGFCGLVAFNFWHWRWHEDSRLVDIARYQNALRAWFYSQQKIIFSA